MALELELEGEHVRLIRVTERALDAHTEKFGRPLPVNVDGAIAAESIAWPVRQQGLSGIRVFATVSGRSQLG